jgi:hypothetical protein
MSFEENTGFLTEAEKIEYTTTNDLRCELKAELLGLNRIPPPDRTAEERRRHPQAVAQMNACIQTLNGLESLNTDREMQELRDVVMANRDASDWYLVGLDDEAKPLFLSPTYQMNPESNIAIYEACVEEFRAKHPVADEDVVVIDPRRYPVFREYILLRSDPAFECRIYGRRVIQLSEAWSV